MVVDNILVAVGFEKPSCLWLVKHSNDHPSRPFLGGVVGRWSVRLLFTKRFIAGFLGRNHLYGDLLFAATSENSCQAGDGYKKSVQRDISSKRV